MARSKIARGDARAPVREQTPRRVPDHINTESDFKYIRHCALVPDYSAPISNRAGVLSSDIDYFSTEKILNKLHKRVLF